MKNNTIIAVDKSGSYRVYLTVTTEMVDTAKQLHECTSLTAAALGRTLTVTGLMGLMLKNEKDKLTVKFSGDGPVIQILATANANGEVKGYISNPYVELPLKTDGHLDVGGAIGKGSLTVIKDVGLKDPYVGNIELVSGEIAQDITQYFMVSEQQPSSVSLGVRIAPDRTHVSAAGGMIIQVLPGASDEAINAIEDVIYTMDTISLMIEDAEGDVDRLFGALFNNMPEEYKPEILDRRNISWLCDCSRERMERGLISIGYDDLKEIAQEDKQAELTCQFCKKRYHFSESELLKLLEEVKRG